MKAKELAALIDGREAGYELTAGEERQAEECGLLALYTPTPNTAVLSGAVKDTMRDISLPLYISRDGFLPQADCEACNGTECPFYNAALSSAVEITGMFKAVGQPCWQFTTAVPHEKFRTRCGPEAYCEGVVFRLEDLPGGPGE